MYKCTESVNHVPLSSSQLCIEQTGKGSNGAEIIVSGESKNAGAKEIHKFSLYVNDTQDAFDIIF